MEYSVGVDIGGTKIAIGIVESSGELLESMSFPTKSVFDPDQAVERIAFEIKRLITENMLDMHQIIGIGMGAPGPLNAKEGEITTPPNLPWRYFPIVEKLKKHMNTPILLENDANAAAIAEHWIGSGVGYENFIYLTVSTGIGAGIISDGRLLIGESGNAGDVGHTVVDPAFGVCSCGQEGCLEMIASGTAIAKYGSQVMGRSLSTEDVFHLYHAGEERIIKLLNVIIQRLGAGCVTLINSLDPEAIVLGGGVANSGEHLLNTLQEYISKYALNPKGREVRIIPAELNQNQGVVGAAALMFDRTNNKMFN
ncbi:MAG TPA: ROK family protein [Virgibacillus sp.]|nr:ROK family protein [Virgibacillus sp.]